MEICMKGIPYWFTGIFNLCVGFDSYYGEGISFCFAGIFNQGGDFVGCGEGISYWLLKSLAPVAVFVEILWERNFTLS